MILSQLFTPATILRVVLLDHFLEHRYVDTYEGTFFKCHQIFSMLHPRQLSLALSEQGLFIENVAEAHLMPEHLFILHHFALAVQHDVDSLVNFLILRVHLLFLDLEK